MVDKSKLPIATSQIQNPIPFLIELLFNLLSQMIAVSTIKLTSQPVRSMSQVYLSDLIEILAVFLMRIIFENVDLN